LEKTVCWMQEMNSLMELAMEQEMVLPMELEMK
jgi:hypothetical protein